MSQANLVHLIEASGVLIRYIVGQLPTMSNSESKLLMPALCGLALGRIQETDVEMQILVSILKNAKTPENVVNSKMSAFGMSFPSSINAAEKEGAPNQLETKWSDLSSVILHELTTPLRDTDVTYKWLPLIEEPVDCTDAFVKANCDLLNSLNAGEIVLRNCFQLSNLNKLYQRFEEFTDSKSVCQLYLAVSVVDAQKFKVSLPQYKSDLATITTALKLPIYESLTSTKVRLLSRCAMSSLYTAVNTMVAFSVLSCNGTSNITPSAGINIPVTVSTGNRTTTVDAIIQKIITSIETSNKAEATSGLAENDDISTARRTVIEALDIFKRIGIILNSTRGNIYYNHVCNGAWLLLHGMQVALTITGQISATTTDLQIGSTLLTQSSYKSKSPLRVVEPSVNTTAGRVNYHKIQQCFGVLNIDISNYCLTLLNELFNELRMETKTAEFDKISVLSEPATFDIFEPYSALQRVVLVMQASNGSIDLTDTASGSMVQLLHILATVTYRKACQLFRQSEIRESEPISYSESTTYLNESISCSESSESEHDDDEGDEDDEDSYLGIWFKETLSPESSLTTEVIKTSTVEKIAMDKLETSTISTLQNKPHVYLELGTNIFNLLNGMLVFQQRHVQDTLRTAQSEQQMMLLSNILKDLDRDAQRSDFESSNNSGNASTKNIKGPKIDLSNTTTTQWQKELGHFSISIGKYMHNLISMHLINEPLQSSLLLHLGVSPWTSDSSHWPLQIYSRTLSVLVQILLLKPPLEKEAACLSVWHRLVNTLVESVCTSSLSSNSDNSEYDDLNVEHAQLLLFIFHSLNLMQKKSVLLLTAGGVIRCANVFCDLTQNRPMHENQIVLLSRLLLLFEYLMKHLYTPPTVLLEQVRWNLFSTITQLDHAFGKCSKPTDLLRNRIYEEFYRKDLEDKLQQSQLFSASNGHLPSFIRPKFYSLAALDSCCMQDFKLDGLAWNFILCTPDKLKYAMLIDALCDILAVSDVASAKVSFQMRCTVNYCFTICLKLLLGIPPSTSHIEALLHQEQRVSTLHGLIWAVRAMEPKPATTYLIVNSLVKQGMYTQFAESLWTRITEHVSKINFNIRSVIEGVKEFNGVFQIGKF